MTELLLVGAGHAHLHVVKRAAELRAAGYRVTLLAPRWFHYSGLASAVAAGDLPVDGGRIDVSLLAGEAGVTFRDGLLASLRTGDRVARTDDGTEIGYDVLSLNVGSVVANPAGAAVDPEVVRVKPLSSLNGLMARLAALGDGGSQVTVVGAGSSGLELAAHLSVRAEVSRVHLLEAGPRVGPGLPAGARRRLERLLTKRGVRVSTGCAIKRVGVHVSSCADGAELRHDAAVLASGLTAPPLVAALGLGDAAGVPVRGTLQHAEHDHIYAVGDCARFLPRPLPRVGVHGVRQGPVLHASLLARVRGEPLPAYRPQRRTLAILDLGGGRGLATWGRWWWEGRAALRLKRRIDRRWLRGYRTG